MKNKWKKEQIMPFSSKDIQLLRNTYNYIIPAYHMNKEHWNTIIVGKKVDKTLVKELIEQSCQLTK